MVVVFPFVVFVAVPYIAVYNGVHAALCLFLILMLLFMSWLLFFVFVVNYCAVVSVIVLNREKNLFCPFLSSYRCLRNFF